MPDSNKESLYFKPVCSEEVLSLTQQLKKKCRAGLLVPVSVKENYLSLHRTTIDPLVHGLNLSLQTGIVPDELKVSNAIPFLRKVMQS